MPQHLRRLIPVVAIVALGAIAPAALAVDTVVPNNQIVQGFQCVGATCLNGEPMSGPTLMSKSQDTPGLRLFQTGGGFGTQTWDIGGNESNFFVRDNTGGSLLPFRIFPGAPTNTLQLAANGEIVTGGLAQQNVAGIVRTDVVSGADVLIALRGIDVGHYTAAGAVHAVPAGADFRAAFGLGGSDATLAPMDVAAIALAGVKALDARVTGIALTPGPKGDTGSTGATGAAGGSLTAANARIASLEKANRRLARQLATLQRQVAALARAGGTAARSSVDGSANGRAGS